MTKDRFLEFARQVGAGVKKYRVPLSETETIEFIVLLAELDADAYSRVTEEFLTNKGFDMIFDPTGPDLSLEEYAALFEERLKLVAGEHISFFGCFVDAGWTLLRIRQNEDWLVFFDAMIEGAECPDGFSCLIERPDTDYTGLLVYQLLQAKAGTGKELELLITHNSEEEILRN